MLDSMFYARSVDCVRMRGSTGQACASDVMRACAEITSMLPVHKKMDCCLKYVKLFTILGEIC